MVFRAGENEGEVSEAGSENVALTADAGPAVYLADISEFQPNINDAAYLNWSKAIVIRAAYGSAHSDHSWFGGARRAQLHSGGARFVGIYQYLVAGQDVTAQAKAFCALVGKLEKGEVPICDLEEGGGSQLARWQTWATVVQGELGFRPWLYSGLFFAQSTGIAPADWVAAYQRTEPSTKHKMWQFSSTFNVPGVGQSDCSLFWGTIDDLANLAFGGSGPTPPAQQDWTDQAIMALPTLNQGMNDSPGHIQYIHRAQALVAVIGQINNIAAAKSLPLNGHFDAATKTAVQAVQKFFGFTGNAVDGVVGPNTWRKLIGA